MSAPARAEVFPPRVSEVYESAVTEHPEFRDLYPEVELKQFVATALGRIASFEDHAGQPLKISPETAENIGAIRIHSGVVAGRIRRMQLAHLPALVIFNVEKESPQDMQDRVDDVRQLLDTPAYAAA